MITISLVDWSPFEFSLREPGEISQVTAHFLELHQTIGLEVDRIEIWQPTTRRFAALFCCDGVRHERDA